MEVSQATGEDRTRLQQLARQDWFPDFDSEDETAEDPWERWMEYGVMWLKPQESMSVYEDLGSL